MNFFKKIIQKRVVIFLLTTAVVAICAIGLIGYFLLKQTNTPSSKYTGNKAIGNNSSNKIGATNYSVVDTNQHICFNDKSAIVCGQSFNGQDAQYQGYEPNYKANGDGTVTDNNTGLMWLQDPGNKISYYDSVNKAKTFTFAGYSDWRLPSIKELYSLIDFSGQDVDPLSTSANYPFINNNVFVFNYGDISAGDRIIDSQWITSTLYVSRVMNNQECFFGVNFADGRIKCYPTQSNKNNGYFLRLVRGNTGYGANNYTDNSDGTVTDSSSGLVWQQNDSGQGMDWKNALAYCEDLSLANKSDWRLPNAKELQYIVDYTRSPDTTGSPAIDPIFKTTSITNEAGQKDFPFFWTGTTHIRNGTGTNAVYLAFGRALGKMNSQIMDVHGAGAQRSDPKSGNINDYPQYLGPQGDVRRLYNFVRCVRGGKATSSQGEDPSTLPTDSSGSLPNQ